MYRELYNGTLGILTEVYDHAVPGVDHFGNEIEYVADFDGAGTIRLTQTDMGFVRLGYCITVHNAQGSQFECIIVVCEDSNIIDNSWLYTSITRAQKQAVIVGSKKIFDRETRKEPRVFNRVIGLSL